MYILLLMKKNHSSTITFTSSDRTLGTANISTTIKYIKFYTYMKSCLFINNINATTIITTNIST